jgi:hypothetical protein
MGPQRGAVPIIIYRTGGTRAKEAKDDATLEALFLLVLSLSHVIYTFPLTYKRGGKTLHRECGGGD